MAPFNIFSKLLLVISACCCFSALPVTGDCGDDNFRLRPTVWPEHYKMEFLVILDDVPGYNRFTAPAKTWITINGSESTSVFTMHAINLTINANSVKVRKVETGEDIPVQGVSYRPEFDLDFLCIEIAEPTEIHQLYEVYMEFLTPIYGNRLNGMYLDFYQDQMTNETRWMATTLFAPYHSRRAFPNFDEPSFRATYDITIGHHEKYHAMANTEIVSSRPIDNMPGWRWDTFSTTPSISSYIIAMIISDMTFVEGPLNNFRNVSVRVYAKPQSIQQGAGNYSAKLVGDVMTYFESMFDIPYPLSKIYSVALPQFFFNAMENWGLITYKEPSLLYLADETTEDERFRIHYVVGHEKAHQYFGNLVACNWWAYVWLKEGFATMYAFYSMEHTNPELAPWVQFLSRTLYVALNFDATIATHPLENFPVNSSAVADIYTRIPYEKGASILRMATTLLTETVFLDGIKRCVNNFQYRSAVQDDVFEQLQQAVDDSPLIKPLLPASVKEILDTWTRQSGFPVLTVQPINLTTLQISQRKFIGGDPSNTTATWWVPIYTAPRANPSLPPHFPDGWIRPNETSTTINIATNQVVIVNPAGTGYYRVLYENSMLEKISTQLTSSHTGIPVTARSKILNDYAEFLVSGYTDVRTFFSITSYLDREIDFIVWDAVYPVLQRISKLLGFTHSAHVFNTYFGEKAIKALRNLEKVKSEMEIEVGMDAMLQSLLMKLACDFGESSCRIHALQLTATDYLGIPKSVQETALCTSTATNTVLWQNIYQFVTATRFGSFSPKRSRLLHSLACSKNHTHLQTLISDVKTNHWFPQTDASELILEFGERLEAATIILQELQHSTEVLNVLSIKEHRDFFTKLAEYPLSDDQIFDLSRISEVSLPERKPAIDGAISYVLKNRELRSRLSSELMAITK